MSDTTGFTKRLNSDGSENKKYVDVLDEDKPIANQKFTCVSFVSPENILKDKNLYFFNEFLKILLACPRISVPEPNERS